MSIKVKTVGDLLSKFKSRPLKNKVFCNASITDEYGQEKEIKIPLDGSTVKIPKLIWV